MGQGLGQNKELRAGSLGPSLFPVRGHILSHGLEPLPWSFSAGFIVRPALAKYTQPNNWTTFVHTEVGRACFISVLMVALPS